MFKISRCLQLTEKTEMNYIFKRSGMTFFLAMTVQFNYSFLSEKYIEFVYATQF